METETRDLEYKVTQLNDAGYLILIVRTLIATLTGSGRARRTLVRCCTYEEEADRRQI